MSTISLPFPLFTLLVQLCCTLSWRSPECEHDQEPHERRRSDAGAAEVDDALPAGLPLLPVRPPLHELLVPHPGVLFSATSPSGACHGRGDHGQPIPAADAAAALGVLHAQADLPDMSVPLVARDGGVQHDAAAEDEREPHHGLPREPPPVHGHGAAAGGVDGAAGVRVDEHPAELEVRGVDGRRRRRRQREALLRERVDAERRAQEPGRRRVRLHRAGHDARAAMPEVDGRDEARRQRREAAAGAAAAAGRWWLWRQCCQRHGGERERVGEEPAVVAARRHVAERGPEREAERAPGGRVGGEAAEGGGRAAERGQRRAVEAAEHEGQDVRGQVLDGRRALGAVVGSRERWAAPVVVVVDRHERAEG